MAEVSPIIVEKKGHIVYWTMNRPAKLNAMNEELYAQLAEAVEEYIAADDLWCAVLTGAGGNFSAGGDLKWFDDRLKTKAKPYDFPAYKAMGRCMKPIIAAIDGYCVASGFNAAVLFSDIRICTERAKFGMPMVRRGLGASGNEGYPMPFLRYINLGNLLYMYLTASLITAEQAYHFGLVSEVVPHEELMQRATELAEMICEGAPIFVRRYKELFRLEAQAPGFDTRTLMSVVMRGLEKSEDVIEGRRAFLEKRKPIWKGK